MIFGINTTRDISKLSQISLAQRLVKLPITILKYHSWYLCKILLLPMQTGISYFAYWWHWRQSKPVLSGSIEWVSFLLMINFARNNTGADLGGGCRGCAPPPPWDDLWFSNTTGILQKKKTMWFIGVEVEQETNTPPPKKNPGSAPVTPQLYLLTLSFGPCLSSFFFSALEYLS